MVISHSLFTSKKNPKHTSPVSACIVVAFAWFVTSTSHNPKIFESTWSLIEHNGSDRFTLQSKSISVLLVNGLHYALMTGLKRSLCHSRSAAGKSRRGCNMAKRKMNSGGRSWMVALILLCNLSEVKVEHWNRSDIENIHEKKEPAVAQKSDFAFNRQNELLHVSAWSGPGRKH